MDSTTGLVACYQFDTGTGTTIYDSTTNDLDSSSSDATWAGVGTFDYGSTSTLNLTGTGEFNIGTSGLNVYNLTCAASTKTTTIIPIGEKMISIYGELVVGGGTLTDSGSSCNLKFQSAATVSDSSGGTPDLSNLYITYWQSTAVVPAMKNQYFIGSRDSTLGGNMETLAYANPGGGRTLSLAGYTLTCNNLRMNSECYLEMGDGTIILTGDATSSHENSILTGGPGATFSGNTTAPAKRTFFCPDNTTIVGTVENLTVTGGSMKVTGKVINCDGNIIQQHQSVDAAQQLDYDSADDRDIMLGRDLDKNTELVG